MGELLPDNSISGYEGYCEVCGEVIKVNLQGNEIGNHACENKLILIGCEESQTVCIEFRRLGFQAYSCDLKPCSGGHPEWHLQMDVRVAVHLKKWRMAVFFPECKHLCWSGERWFANGHKDMQLRLDAFEFFKWCYHYPYEELGIEFVAVENSLSYFLERNGYAPDQKVHPFHFGDPFRKTICLWFRGLKPLIPTNITFKRDPAVHNMWPKKGIDRSELRAKTYPGPARAMAEQWGILLITPAAAPPDPPPHDTVRKDPRVPR